MKKIKKYTFFKVIELFSKLQQTTMRNGILVCVVIVFLAGTIISSCQTAAEKVENAENKLQEAKVIELEARIDLNKMRQDSIAEYQKFKKDSEEKIAAHDKSIAEFKARIVTEKIENKAKYEAELAELEQKNSDLKKKLEDFKEGGRDNWESFKTEFSNDMNKLGEAFKNLTVKNHE